METYNGLYSTFVAGMQEDIWTSLSDGQKGLLLQEPLAEWSVIASIDRRENCSLSYLIALTRLGKEFERCVITNTPMPDPSMRYGFHLHPFLLSCYDLLFDVSQKGEPKQWKRGDVHQANAFKWFRQVVLLFSKNTNYTPDEPVEKQVAAFIERMRPRGFTTLASPLGERFFYHEVLLIARSLINDVLHEGGRLHPSIQQWIDEPFGRHGPGAVADGSIGRKKWLLRSSPRVDEGLFRGHDAILSSVKKADADVEYTSRLAVVPKDMTKNRLICIEPKELMFVQQGLMQVLYGIIDSSPLTRSVINLFDQSSNFWFSRNRNFSTIDLADASDLLSLHLARLLLPKRVFDLLTRYRSSSIELPDGSVLRNYGAAFTMGNALCFPIESLIFWAISLAAMLSHELRLGTFEDVAEVLDLLRRRPSELKRRFRLRVFGDDIVVPNEYLEVVTQSLTCAGMTVNASKTCGSITPVRESCGSYWWGNFDVRIVKFHCMNGNQIHEWVSLMEQLPSLVELGYQACAEELHAHLVTFHPYPKSGAVSIRDGLKGGYIRWNNDLQRLEARVPRSVKNEALVNLVGDIGLYAWFTGQATRTFCRRSAQRVEWQWIGIQDLFLV